MSCFVFLSVSAPGSYRNFRKAKAAFTFLLFFFVFIAHAQNGDINLLRKIYTPEPLKSDPFFKFTGKTVTPISIATPLTYFAFAPFTDKGKPLKENLMFKNGVTSSLCVIGAGLLSTGLKYTIKRERPWVTYNDIRPKDNPHTWSFPSGHTTFAFATATSIALIERKWYYTVPVFGWALCVGYSRLHLGVHYPTDVLAGAAIGTGTSILMYYVSQRMFR